MSPLESALGALLARLKAYRADYAIVGGLAVSARTEPRFTRDADVCVLAPDDAFADALIHSLRSDGYRVLALVEQEAAARIATVRLAAPEEADEGVILDLLFASSGVEREVVETAQGMELFDGLMAPIASVPALVALKVLARDDVERPQDRVDLGKLMEVASPADMLEARRLLDLIHERGYDRGRDLRSDLDRLEAERSR